MKTTAAGRIIGLDIARALAIIGMMYAHIVFTDEGVGHELTAGYPSTLFAVLSGMSVSILMRRYGRNVVTTRSLWLLVVGALLVGFSGAIAVVVGMIAVAQLVLAPCARWGLRAQLRLVVALFVFSGALSDLFPTYGVDFLGAGQYPLGAWLFYTLLGIVVFPYLQARWFGWLIPAGALALAGRMALFFAGVSGSDFWERGDALGVVLDMFFPEPHSGGWGDMACTALVALGVIAATRRVRLQPVEAFGSMALSVYVVHVLVTGMGVAGLFGGADPIAVEQHAASDTASPAHSPSPTASAESFVPTPPAQQPEADAVLSPELMNSGRVDLQDPDVEHYLQLAPTQRQAVGETLVALMRSAQSPQAAREAVVGAMNVMYSQGEDYPLDAAESAHWQALQQEVLAAPSPDDAMVLAISGAQRDDGAPDEENPGEGQEPVGRVEVQRQWVEFAAQLGVLLVVCSVYRLRWRRGPLEWLLHRLSVGARTQPVGPAPTPAPALGGGVV